MEEAKLLDLARAGKLDDLISNAEGLEVDCFDKPMSSRFYQILMMALLVKGDVPSARHVSKRCGGTCLSDPVTNHLVHVIHALWNKNFDVALKHLTSVRIDPLNEQLEKAIILRVATLHASTYNDASVAGVCSELGGINDGALADALKGSYLTISSGKFIKNAEAAKSSSQAWGAQALPVITDCAMYLRQPYDG